MKTILGTACRSCRGTGQITVGIAYPLTIECATCKGAKYGEYVAVKCTACDGARGIPCSRCSGAGILTVFKPFLKN
jgi:RecJ-like exonuclease